MREIDFIGRSRLWYIVSATLVIVSLIALVGQGIATGQALNLGIDFTGGSIYDLEFDQVVAPAEVRAILANIDLEKSVIRVSPADPKQAFLKTEFLDDDQEARMFSALKAGVGEFEQLRSERVDAVIGSELLLNALIALIVAGIAMVAYITWRFEYRFAIAAIVALLHDSIITLGVFSILGVEITSAFVAAILTIIGYSVNDTIVIFDRIRENLKGTKRGNEGGVVNRSLNETLVRSINTSVTTFLAVSAIFIFGGATIKDFALALLVGVLLGTYSSIFVASPLWVSWRNYSHEKAVAR